MTPLAFYWEYRDLFVTTLDGITHFGIDVHEYRNAKDYYQGTTDISADHDIEAGMDIAYAALSRKIRKHGTKISRGTYRLRFPIEGLTGAAGTVVHEEIVKTTEIVQVYHGKGSPDQIRQALRLAAAFGLVASTAAAMNAYCTDYVGIDCSGFVGNYLRHEGSTQFGPSTPAKSFAPANLRLSSLDQIEDRCVLNWKNVGHVAIIDQVVAKRPGNGTVTEVECIVCESTGSSLIPGDVHTDGMNCTTYLVKSVDAHKVFKVKRGIGGSGLNSVYIAKHF